MAIKLIAIDMDGTLLTPQHEVSPRVRQAIAAARDKGVAIVLATGRPFVGVQQYLQMLDLQHEGQFCITNNGALVQQAEDGECVAEVALTFSDFLFFEKMARELGVHFQALTKTLLFTPNKDISQYTVHESSVTGIPLRYRAVDEMDANSTFPKVMMIDDPDKLDEAISRIPQEARDRYTIMKSSAYYLEILDKRVNKGAGVKALADRLGLSAEQVMAIGDQENDIAMLEFAGTGVAMGNAIESVKKVAQFVTKTNIEDGVAHAIEKYVL